MNEIHDLLKTTSTVDLDPNSRYLIDRPIELGSNTVFNLNGSTIQMTKNDQPIFTVNQGRWPGLWKVQNGTLTYSQKQNPETIAIELAGDGKTTQRGQVDRVEIRNSGTGIGLPSQTNTFAFLTEVSNVMIFDPSGYGVKIPSNNGSHTNLSFKNTWVHRGAGGFNIAGVQGLSMDNCGCDHINGNIGAFRIRNCLGRAGTLWTEKEIVNISSGGWYGMIINQSDFHVDCFYTYANEITLNGSAHGSTIRAIGGSLARVDVVQDNSLFINDNSSDNYYQCLTDRNKGTRLYNLKYTNTGDKANPNNGEFTSEHRLNTSIYQWDGKVRREYI